MYCCVAAGEGHDDVLREPCRLLIDSKEDIEDGGVLVLRVYTGEVFRCKVTVDVVAKVLGREEICFQLVYMIYCLV